MKLHTLLCLCLQVSLIQSCIYEPGCEEPPLNKDLQVILHWPDSGKNASGVFILFYGTDGGKATFDFLPPEGGNLLVPTGEYNILAYSNNSETIVFQNMDKFETAEAFAEKNKQPDRLYTGIRKTFSIGDSSRLQPLEIGMQPLVRTYPFTFRGVTGMEYIERIIIYISGISTSVSLSDPTVLLPTDSLRCTFTRSTDGVYGSFNSFGHGSDETPHIFTIRFESGGESSTYTYDVTQMLNQQNRIDIQTQITFKPVTGGGFKPGVDDWEDDVAIVPL